MHGSRNTLSVRTSTLPQPAAAARTVVSRAVLGQLPDADLGEFRAASATQAFTSGFTSGRFSHIRSGNTSASKSAAKRRAVIIIVDQPMRPITTKSNAVYPPTEHARALNDLNHRACI